MFETKPMDRGIARTGFLAAFLFAFLASASLVCERLAHGRSPYAWLLSIAVTAGALVMFVSRRIASGMEGSTSVTREVIVPIADLLGLVTATAIVHLLVAASVPDASLVETPNQIVNDAALVLVTSCSVWSFASPSPAARTTFGVAAITMLCGYVASMPRWHVDPFPGHHVQLYVIAQSLGTSLALFIYFRRQSSSRG